MKSKLDSPCNVLIVEPHPSLSLWILHKYKKHPLSPALLFIIKKKEQVKVTVIKAKVLKPTPPSIKVKPFL